ncbi:MAG: DUF362 domain-containing protein, partial [Thermoplasmata archaeon]|nr:DUF362 domain-containing protein [Thermoplasmata archaeon]
GCRAGKQHMHNQEEKPRVTKEKCIGCGECVTWCPEEAIQLIEEKAVIDIYKCVVCGECTATCREGAVAIRWEDEGRKMQARIAEYMLAVLQNKKDKKLFLNFLMDITPGCLCVDYSDAPIIPDIGIIASVDPVAVDKAAYDLTLAAQGIPNTALKKAFKPGQDKFKDLYPSVATLPGIEYAAEIGLGSLDYELVEI